MARVNTQIGGGGDGSVVGPGRYLFQVKRAWLGQANTGTHSMNVSGVVREGAKAVKLTFFLYFKRADGTKIKVGCETIQAIGKACGIADPTDYDTDELEGKVIGLDLDVEEDEGHPPRNVIAEAFAAVEEKGGGWSLPDERSEGEDDESDVPF